MSTGTIIPSSTRLSELRKSTADGKLRSKNPAVDELLKKLEQGTEVVCGSFRQVSDHTQSGGSDSFTQFDDHND